MLTTNNPLRIPEVESLLDRVVNELIPNGYFFYVWTLSPEMDVEEFNREIVDFIAHCKSRADGTEVAKVEHLWFNRECITMSTEGPHPLFAQCGSRRKDIRKEPASFCGYRIRCEFVHGRYVGFIDEPIVWDKSRSPN